MSPLASDDNFPPEVPALASFKLHKFVSEKIAARGLEYRTGVVYDESRPRNLRHDRHRGWRRVHKALRFLSIERAELS